MDLGEGGGERSRWGRRRRRRRGRRRRGRRRRDKFTSHFTFMTDPNESLRYSVDVLLVFEYPGLFGFGLSIGAAARLFCGL